jgi:hypothetical protein
VDLRAFVQERAGDFTADAGRAGGDDYAQTFDAEVHDDFLRLPP